MVYRGLFFELLMLLVIVVAPAAPAEDLLESKPGKAKLNLDLGLPPGDGADGEIEITAGYKFVRGTKQGKLWVKAEITPGYHTFSTTQPKGGSLPSIITVTASGDFKVGDFQPDHPPHIVNTKVSPVPSEEYEKEVIWTAPLELVSAVDVEKLKITLAFSGQICKNSCIPISLKNIRATFDGYSAAPGEYRPADSKVTWIGHIEPKVVTPGGKAQLVLTAKPDQGWHLYGYERIDPVQVGGKPTLIVLSQATGWRQSAVVASQPPKIVTTSEGTVQEYTEPVTFTIDLLVPRKAKLGVTRLSGLLGFQTCQESRCIPPDGAAFDVAVEVAAKPIGGAAPLAFEEAAYSRVAKHAADAPPPYGVIEPQALAAQLGLSLLGGLLLNLMPCVLPVLGLKILSFAQQAGQSRAKVLALNFWYTLGLVAVFMVLATLSAFLNFGWGEQFTQTWFKLTMLVLTFAFALSFLGVWEMTLPGFATAGKADELQAKEGALGAFFKGVFTTVLGVSCSGPFLGGVFAYTLTQTPIVTYLIFLCVGIGLASPFLAVALIPQFQKLLPKPGEWMNTFKHLGGFAMLGVVVYLFSTIHKDYYIATLTLLVGIGFCCWWIGRVPVYEETSKQVWAWAGGVAVAAAIGWASFTYLGPVVKIYPWTPFSPASLAKLQTEGKTVMVDFTADWCLNCQLNFRYAINTGAVKDVVQRNGIIAMEADWTEANPELEAKLNELNSRSIPVLAIYPAGRPDEVIILRDLVSVKQVIDALNEAGPSKEIKAATFGAGLPTSPKPLTVGLQEPR